MGLTKVNNFGGEAELLGALYPVTFDGEKLTIEGVTLEGVYAILEALSMKQITAVRVGGIPTVAAPARSTSAPATPRKEETASAPDPQRIGNGKVNETEAVQRKNDLRDNANKTKPAEPKTEPVKAAPEPAAEAKAASALLDPSDPALEFPPKEEAPPFDTGEIPDKVLKTGRFIEVMDWVMKTNGLKVTQVDEIVAQCEKLRLSITVVGRVRDMKDKVVSNLAAYSEAGGA